ncbi:MAG: hypothetical protein ACP5O0_04575 [Acidimicrobiales bacterium]
MVDLDNWIPLGLAGRWVVLESEDRVSEDDHDVFSGYERLGHRGSILIARLDAIVERLLYFGRCTLLGSLPSCGECNQGLDVQWWYVEPGDGLWLRVSGRSCVDDL